VGTYVLLDGSEGVRIDCEGFLEGYNSRSFWDLPICVVRRRGWTIGIIPTSRTKSVASASSASSKGANARGVLPNLCAPPYSAAPLAQRRTDCVGLRVAVTDGARDAPCVGAVAPLKLCCDNLDACQRERVALACAQMCELTPTQ
jgi:hypothetical protein